MVAGGEDKVRIDRWLWAARFFKTRGLAARAVSGGHVHVNGERVKPSRRVGAGEMLRIRRGMVEFVVEVIAVSERRGPAKVAAGLYRETPESLARREAAAETRRLVRAAAVKPPATRPDKRERRLIRSFVRGE